MLKKSGKFVFLIAMVATFFTACAVPKASLPTPDLNLVRTEAVVTAVAQLTKQAVLVPQSTQTLTISTLEPTVTPPAFVMTATPFYSGGGSPGGGSGSGGGSLSTTPIPTWTPIVYGAVFVNQNYLDGYVCPTGEQPDFKITFQNIGVATWKATQFYIKRIYNSPDIKLTNYDLYPLVADVPPGAKATFTLDVACPTFPGGPWTTQWGLVNDNGEIFAKFYFRFYTGIHPTETPTRTRTPSPG